MATKSTGAPRFELRRGSSGSTPVGWARTDDDEDARPVANEASATTQEAATTQQGPGLPWLRILISVVGTIVLAALFGVPFPDVLLTAVIAAAGALWIGRGTFRRIAGSQWGNRVVAAVAGVAVAAVTFVPLYYVVLFVWVILWLETTPEIPEM